MAVWILWEARGLLNIGSRDMGKLSSIKKDSKMWKQKQKRTSRNCPNDAGGPPPNRPHRAMVEEAKFLMQKSGSTIRHIFQEANHSADHLARLGAEQEQLVESLGSP